MPSLKSISQMCSSQDCIVLLLPGVVSSLSIFCCVKKGRKYLSVLVEQMKASDYVTDEEQSFHVISCEWLKAETDVLFNPPSLQFSLSN